MRKIMYLSALALAGVMTIGMQGALADAPPACGGPTDPLYYNTITLKAMGCADVDKAQRTNCVNAKLSGVVLNTSIQKFNGYGSVTMRDGSTEKLVHYDFCWKKGMTGVEFGVTAQLVSGGKLGLYGGMTQALAGSSPSYTSTLNPAFGCGKGRLCTNRPVTVCYKVGGKVGDLFTSHQAIDNLPINTPPDGNAAGANTVLEIFWSGDPTIKAQQCSS